jgi:hypothetical protein
LFAEPKTTGEIYSFINQHIKNTQNKNQETPSLEDEQRIFKKLFKESVEDSDRISRIAECVSLEKEKYKFREKRYKLFLDEFENMYKGCLRNCKFEIKYSFSQCCLNCQNYFYKVMYDMNQSTLQT